jgi:squamous cell carcinoma antigen recognized by T-cells 3
MVLDSTPHFLIHFFPAAYARALSTTLFSRGRKGDPEVDADQIVPLVLARAGAAKRAVEAGRDDGDSLATLIKVVEEGIAMVRQGKNVCCLTQLLIATISTLPSASSSGDPRFRLEKFLSEFVCQVMSAANKLSEPFT